MKIIINRCHGGFILSDRAKELYGREVYEESRTDPKLIEIVESLGEEASGWASQLEVEEIPSGQKYLIEEYDGYETIVTPDSLVWEVAE